MADPRQDLRTMPDDELAGALRELRTSLAFPSALATQAVGPDLAGRVRRSIELSPPRPSIWQRLGLGDGPAGRAGRASGVAGGPMRRGLVLALVALLVLAAVAGAVGLGLPGLRIIFGQGPSPQPTTTAAPGATATANPSVSPSISPLGAGLALGTALPFADAERLAGFTILLPTYPDLGPPDASYLNGQRVALVWRSRANLPETDWPGVGLVISEFRGRVDEGYFQKILGEQTTLTPVSVGGSKGYWIGGAPHFFMYVDPAGNFVTDDHRTVGDTLLWTTGDMTYRVETSLGMAAAIKLGESLR